MIPEIGFRRKVIGSRSDMAAVGPTPGRTPTNVPITHPIKQNKRLIGWRATPNPFKTFPIKSMPNALKIPKYL
jgi:hypothetical protein